MPGPLGTGSGGGAGTITSVTGGTGISVAGSGSLTVSNTGVTSLVAGSGVSLSSATGAVTLSATGGSTLGAIGVPTTDGMIIGIKSGGASSYASSRMLGADVSTTLATTPPYPDTMPMDMAGGTLNAADSLLLGRVTYLPAASNVTLLESSLIPAYGSTFGTKKVGMTFHVGTKQQILRRVAGLSYMSQSDNVNAVIVGYMGSGPRILLQDYDLATDETDSIRLVAKQVVLNGGMTVGVKNITDANTTLDHTYHVVLCNGTANYTVTLPDARRRDSGGFDQETSDAGRMYHIKKRSASTVSLTIATTSSQTIDGSTTLSITQQYTSLCLVSDGSNWNII
jgi:hypothetical protein